MSITRLYLPGHEAEANQQLLMLEHHLLQDLRLFQPSDQVRAPVFASMEMPSYLVQRLTPDQRTWMVNGTYLQAGYYDEPGVRDIHMSIGVGMTLYDHGVQLTGSDDPTSHPPFNLPAEGAAAAERVMGNHYRSGLIWICRGLLPHRAEVLTKGHAILCMATTCSTAHYGTISAPHYSAKNNLDDIQA